MNKTALELSPQQWQSYHLAAIPFASADSERWQRGWQLANLLAKLLREQFGATRVAVFGSLNSPDWFDAHSDIDLAVWGIPPTQFYRAVAAVTAISDEFEVDLIDGDTCLAPLRQTLEREAVTI
jgi:predicted nucleotidyltransferase